MKGHRPSLLPIAQFCGMAPKLSEKHGAGRPAAIGRAYHAILAKAHDAPDLVSRLTKEEQDLLLTFRAPVDVVIGDVVLTYDAAEKELPIAVDEMGFLADKEPFISGTLDFAWVHDGVAYVADIKKTQWSSEGPDSLQLQVYGWAYAQMRGCHHYCTGLWLATEGEWSWSDKVVDIDSPEGQAIWERIYAAATNNSNEYSTGPHCPNCWSRMHCPEYVLPASVASSWLAPVADGVVPSPEAALELLRKGQAFEETWKFAKDQLKELVRRGHLKLVDGKQMWAPVMTSGRKSVDVEKLKAELGPEVERFMKTGADYTTFRWVKAR